MNRRVVLGMRLCEISIKDVGSLFSVRLVLARVRSPFRCLPSTAESSGTSNGVPGTIAALYSLPASLSGLSLRRFSADSLAENRRRERFDPCRRRESVAVPTAAPGNRHRRKYNIGR